MDKEELFSLSDEKLWKAVGNAAYDKKLRTLITECLLELKRLQQGDDSQDSRSGGAARLPQPGDMQLVAAN